MDIIQIHSMCWANPEHTAVQIYADTDTGTNESIGTPYDTSSIIWEKVSAFPISEITEYVAKERISASYPAGWVNGRPAL